MSRLDTSNMLVATRAPVVRGRRPRSPYLFLLPMAIFIAVLFVYPLVQMVLTTLFTTNASGIHFTLEPFQQFFAGGRGANLILRTLRIAVITTVLTFLLAFPVTLWIREASPRVRGLVIVLILSPMLTSDVVRTLGWVTILGPQGLIANVFSVLHLPAPNILYTEPAIEIGLTQIFIGYMVLSLLSSVLRIPDDVINAAANLGANSWQIILRVVLPQSVPGIVGGCAIVFPLAASTYVTASLLGGTSNPVLGTELFVQAMSDFNFAGASAVGIILFVLILLVVVIVALISWLATRKTRTQ